MNKVTILKSVVIIILAIFAIRLFVLQIVNKDYKRLADNNVLRYEIQNPPRGEIYDRNGEYLAQSIATYDLMLVPRNMAKEGFDTVMLANVANVTVEQLVKEIERAKRYSRHRASVVVKQMPKESKLLFDEGHYPGFYTNFRTKRYYPRNVGGNLLGDIGEVTERIINNNSYYTRGDYIGYSGIENAYEDVLRGVKGTKVNMVDVRGTVMGSYENGIHDKPSIPGTAITTTIDLALQELGEELMKDKVGSIIAIEPSTGEILMMVSSPTYDPDELIGRDRGNNYMRMLNNKRNPLFNRAVMSAYPPGSTFKVANGLIGLQEGVLTADQRYPCYNGYTIGRGVKCHSHASPLNLYDAIANSCNAYFCFVMRNIIDNKKYKDIKEGFSVWEEYVRSFGFGRKLGSDFSSEYNGFVPSADYYTRSYGRWNSLTVISLSIGQGELGCSPLQMANFAATIANRGFYYIPHVVKKIDGRDSLDAKFYEKHYTKVDSKHFETVVEGMYRTVHGAGGTGHVAYIPDMDVCGKTGTAQNPHGRDHSTFMAFAPRNNPRIAISVYVENAGFGSTVAAPIASLLMEQYLTGKVERQYLVDQIKSTHIAYPHYDR